MLLENVSDTEKTVILLGNTFAMTPFIFQIQNNVGWQPLLLSLPCAISYISIYHTSEKHFSRALIGSSEVISQVLFTSEQQKRNKMASRFDTVT